MKLRFQADADLNRRIFLGLTRLEPSIDIQSHQAAGLHGVPDPEVLAFSAREGRMLVTHDKKTMPGHFAEFILTAHSPGVLLIPQRYPIGPAIEGLYLLWSASEAEEWENQILRLPL